MSRWFDLIPQQELDIYNTAGFARRQQPGKAPALLVVDCTLSFTGSRGKSVVEAIQEYKTACGPAGWKSLPFIKEAIALFRAKDWPVVFSRQSINDQNAVGGATKAANEYRGEGGNQILPEIAPLPSEWLLEKPKASCFFGTPLVSYLHQKQVDTLVVVGVSTSGCVRASVIDAFSYGFKVFIIEEGCFDRSDFAHAANLFDMDAKYANVITFEEFKALLFAM